MSPYLLSDEIEDYAAAHTTPPTGHLEALAQETRETLNAPQMLTGDIEGRFLEFLVFLAQPRFVLEIGTYSGYSARMRTRSRRPRCASSTTTWRPMVASST